MVLQVLFSRVHLDSDNRIRNQDKCLQEEVVYLHLSDNRPTLSLIHKECLDSSNPTNLEELSLGLSVSSSLNNSNPPFLVVPSK